MAFTDLTNFSYVAEQVTASNVATARTLKNLAKGQPVFISGADEAGDGGGGFFVYDPSTVTDDGIDNLALIHGGSLLRETVKRSDLPYVDIREFGSVEVADHTTLIQTAFDQAPIGSTLYFPPRDYEVGATGACLTLSRQLNLLSGGGRILSNPGNSTTDTLLVKVTDAGTHGDVRGMWIRGFDFNWYGAVGRHHVVILGGLLGFGGPVTDALPQANPEISNCLVSGGANGAAIFIAGEVHSARIMNCPAINNGIEFGSYEGSSVPADAQRVEGNLIFGTRTGIKMTVQFGSYSHTIQRNVIVPRDGAIELVNISQVKVRDNQFEQNGTNANPYTATVIVRGVADVCDSIEITGNNFGAGTDVNYSISMNKAKHCLIENNDFYPAAIADIVFNDADASYNRVGYNRPRGTRSGFPLTDLVVADAGVGNYGILRYVASLGLSNSWATDGFIYKALDGKVTIEGTFTAGVTTGGTLMFTLPVGARPVYAMRIGVETSSGAGHVLVATNGQVTVGSLPSNTVYFNGFTFLAYHEV